MLEQTKGYVINLNRSPERLRKFFSQTSANLFTRMPAVDKKLLELFDLEIFFNTSLCESLMGRKVTSCLYPFPYCVLESNCK